MSIEKLNLLGIFNRNQFSKGDLRFWRSKKSNQILLSDISKQLKNERLIEINNIYNELKEYDLQTLENYFPKKNRLLKQNKKRETFLQSQRRKLAVQTKKKNISKSKTFWEALSDDKDRMEQDPFVLFFDYL